MTAYGARIGGLLAALVLTVALAGCGDNDGGESNGGATPSSVAPGSPAFTVPPEFRDCAAEQGIDLPASGDLHDLDPARVQQAIQACAEFLHP